MAEAISWWLVVQLLSLLSLFPAFLLFRSLPDRGYGLSKAFGLLLTAYVLWVLAWAGFLPNSRPTLVLVVFSLALASVALAARRDTWRSLVDFLRRGCRVVLATEMVFTVAFFSFALYRAYQPAIAGTEQPMDFAFLNAILRSSYFPPHDPWLSGYSISYYYFGYLIQTIPIKLAGIPSSVGYNLALSSLFALTMTGAFSLGYNLVAPRSPRAAPWVGALAGILVAVAGNLQGALEVLRARGLGSAALWQWIGVNGALTPYQSPSWFPTEYFWWWHATRVINTLRITTDPTGAILMVDDRLDYTITEFPFFSFMLGDLHPHVMALPFVFLALGLSLNALRSEQPLGFGWIRRQPLAFGGAALVLGALGFINSWDLPTYGAVFFAALLWRASWDGRPWGRALLRLLALVAALGLASVLLYLPFYLGPKPQTQGPGLVLGVGTRPVHFFIIWGLFLFALGAFLLGRAKAAAGTALARPRWALWSLVAALSPLALWALGQAVLAQAPRSGVALPWSMVGAKAISLVPLVAVVAFLLLLMGGPRQHEDRGTALVLLLALVGFSLTLGTELFLIRDAFGNRMNTLFKVYYQAWVLFAMASAYGLYYVAVSGNASGYRWIVRPAWGLCWGVLVLSALAYPVAASYTRTNMFSGKPSLDGLAFVKERDPGEYEAIRWLNSQVEGAPVILEAVGGSYSDYGRVASRTGLPTLVQWPGHQLQWRGPTPVLGERERVADQIYRSLDKGAVLALLRQYEVEYIYVGRLERARYGDTPLDKFGDFMDVAFQGQGVIIYKVRGRLS